jgi:hypothetical protein
VAAVAQAALGFREREGVRLVALKAGDAPVKLVVSVSGLVAPAAASGGFLALAARRVWVVAARATASRSELWVIGMHPRVAVHASRLGCAANIVRRVAAGALVVSRHTRRGQDQNVCVTRTTRSRRALVEGVRLVATHALAVPSGKQRRLANERRLGGMTALAGGERLGRRCVLVLMAGGAHEFGRFPEAGVVGRKTRVASHAGTRLGRRILVRAVTTHAIARAVNHDGGRSPLADRVTARAIGRRELDGGGARGMRGLGKGVTSGALRLGAGAKALRGVDLGVVNATLSFVTRGAASGRGLANAVGVELVALRARDVLFAHVQLVAARRASDSPSELNVEAEPPRASRCIGVRARSEERDDERQQSQRPQTSWRTHSGE